MCVYTKNNMHTPIKDWSAFNIKTTSREFYMLLLLVNIIPDFLPINIQIKQCKYYTAAELEQNYPVCVVIFDTGKRQSQVLNSWQSLNATWDKATRVHSKGHHRCTLPYIQ